MTFSLDKTTHRYTKTVWFRTRAESEEGCWYCDNIPNQDGYIRVGKQAFGGRGLGMLHVLFWESIYGDKPEGYELDHLCNNRGCFNPQHLELLPERDHKTKSNKGRVGYLMERKTDKEVADMYLRVRREGQSINSVCREYNINRSTLSSIINKRSRCGVTDALDKTLNNKEEQHNEEK